MGLAARTEGIFYGKPTGSNSERTTAAVVAEVNDDADRWLRSIVGGLVAGLKLGFGLDWA